LPKKVIDNKTHTVLMFQYNYSCFKGGEVCADFDGKVKSGERKDKKIEQSILSKNRLSASQTDAE